MAVNILTSEDLENFKRDLFNELKIILRNEAPSQKKWLKSDEVKKLLKVSPGTLQTLCINGTLEFTKLGGIIYYDNDHIQKTFANNLRPANLTNQ